MVVESIGSGAKSMMMLCPSLTLVTFAEWCCTLMRFVRQS
jgi:hypothetical protein